MRLNERERGRENEKLSIMRGGSTGGVVVVFVLTHMKATEGERRRRGGGDVSRSHPSRKGTDLGQKMAQSGKREEDLEVVIGLSGRLNTLSRKGGVVG